MLALKPVHPMATRANPASLYQGWERKAPHPPQPVPKNGQREGRAGALRLYYELISLECLQGDLELLS